MMPILRSESKVKLANRLFRTNSPGLLSGSTLTGAMTTGPFLSPEVPLTGGRGGFSPTGEAEESQDTWVSLKQTKLRLLPPYFCHSHYSSLILRQVLDPWWTYFYLISQLSYECLFTMNISIISIKCVHHSFRFRCDWVMAQRIIPAMGAKGCRITSLPLWATNQYNQLILPNNQYCITNCADKNHSFT